jgi:O-antigen/teichoic acid export membrane protein
MGEPSTTVAHEVRGLFGRDSLYMLVWGLQLVCAAALTPVITRVMGTSQFGEVATAIAVMQVLFAVAGLGMQTAIQRQFAQGGVGDARRLLTLSLLLAALVTVAADSTGWLWSRQLGFDSYSGPLRLAVFWAGASAVTNSALGLLRSQDRLATFSGVGMLQSVVAEAMSLLLVTAVRPTASMFVLGRLLAQIFAVALALSLLRPAPLRPRHRALALAGLAYALPLVPAELSTFILNTADRLIIRNELGLTPVARYQIAYNIGAVPQIMITILNVAWMPRFFALHKGTERTAVLAASRDALYRLLMPVMVGLSLGAPLLLRLWAPPAYRPDDLLLVTAIVIVTVLPYTAGLSMTRGLLAVGRTGTVAGATIVAAGVNIVLNLVLVPHFELVGSAVATLAAFAVLHGVLYVRGRAVVPIEGTTPARLLELAGAVAAALLASALPTSFGYLVLRTALVVVTLIWFGRILLRLSTRPPVRWGLG